MRRARFQIADLPAPLNWWSRQHWSVRDQLQRAARATVAVAADDSRQVGWWDGRPVDPARVVITFHLPPGVRRDLDGLVPKAWLDGLVAAGVLVDDAASHVVELVLRVGPPAATAPGWAEVVVEEVPSDGKDGAAR